MEQNKMSSAKQTSKLIE